MPALRPLLLCAAAVCFVLSGCDATEVQTTATPTANAQTKVDVCHATASDENPYELISIADAAYDAHVAHGDASPGDPVPGQPGYAFDDTCGVVLAAACPCFMEVNPQLLETQFVVCNEGFNASTSTELLVLEDGPYSGNYLVSQGPDFNSCGGDLGAGNYISDAEAMACETIIRDYAADNGIPCD